MGIADNVEAFRCYSGQKPVLERIQILRLVHKYQPVRFDRRTEQGTHINLILEVNNPRAGLCDGGNENRTGSMGSIVVRSETLPDLWGIRAQAGDSLHGNYSSHPRGVDRGENVHEIRGEFAVLDYLADFAGIDAEPATGSLGPGTVPEAVERARGGNCVRDAFVEGEEERGRATLHGLGEKLLLTAA